MASNSWRYRIGLLLIGSVVLIWVASAEVTQIIFTTYRHPFILTWLGAALLSIYLPIALIKDVCTSWFAVPSTPLSQTPTSPLKQTPLSKGKHAAVLVSPRRIVTTSPHLRPASGSTGDIELSRTSFVSDASLSEENGGEERALLGSGDAAGKEKRWAGSQQMTAVELAKTACILAPLWLMTEYLSNASLSLTSVATTTILSSTSGLFTLAFGVLIGQDAFTLPKVISVLVCISGVIMTELGKTPSEEDVLSNLGPSPSGDPSQPGHSIVGDFLGLASAASYGFYTTMLKKYAGDEDSEDCKTDMQKLFGAIGLVTLFGLWWLEFPLVLLGWEPAFRLPRSYGLDEDILANGLVGSVVSDYCWALSVVWTTPLVATLGLSLTIPLAMLADMVLHGQSYSWVYILGSAQVFSGFMIANLADRFTSRAKAAAEL